MFESRIRLLGIKNGKGLGEIYSNKPIDFKKGRSVSQLGKFIRAQQIRREKILQGKQPKTDLETMFINELTDEEAKIGAFLPDEYNCNALDMKEVEIGVKLHTLKNMGEYFILEIEWQ